jgi:hypothetical protein
MQLKSILTRVERYKSFVYGKAQWVENAAKATIEVRIEPVGQQPPDLFGLRLKQPENLTEKQTVKLTELLQYNLQNWFRARGSVSAGAVEGLNNKAKLTTRKAYGVRTYEGIETALYHTLGALPEPEFTHEFCRGGELN